MWEPDSWSILNSDSCPETSLFGSARVEFSFCSVQQTTSPSMLFGSLPH